MENAMVTDALNDAFPAAIGTGPPRAAASSILTGRRRPVRPCL